MIPLTITAHLSTPPVTDGRPILFDGILLGAVGEEMGRSSPAGWADAADVYAAPLPLARVETPHGWWYAASQFDPHGPEATSHLNRAPLTEGYSRWTSARSYNQAAGPDKRLRSVYYYRPGMLCASWTCVGDREQIAHLLHHITGIGRMIGHGHGWVRRWTVEQSGPPLSAYGSDLALRHLPVDAVQDLPPTVSARHLPLRPPYHRRSNGVRCWQVQP
jgi:hypothetical protein